MTLQQALDRVFKRQGEPVIEWGTVGSIPIAVTQAGEDQIVSYPVAWEPLRDAMSGKGSICTIREDLPILRQRYPKGWLRVVVDGKLNRDEVLGLLCAVPALEQLVSAPAIFYFADEESHAIARAIEQMALAIATPEQIRVADLEMAYRIP